jgi:AhpC/TSA family
MAKLKPEFDKRNVKVIGLSVDRVEKHKGWSKDIEETQGYDLVPDDDRSKLRRGVARRRFAAAHREAQSVDAGQLESRRRRHHRGLGDERRGEEDLSGRMEGTEAIHSDRAAAWRAEFIG